VHPHEARGARQQPVERVGGEPAAEEHLDVVDGLVGQALARQRHDPGAGCRRADLLEIVGAVTR
jgi:hypothetical protein